MGGGRLGRMKKSENTATVEIPDGLMQAIKKAIAKGYFDSIEDFVLYATRVTLFSSQHVPPVAVSVERKDIPKLKVISLVLETVKTLEKCCGVAKVEDVKRIAGAVGVTEETFKEALKMLLHEGYIYFPRDGEIRSIKL